MPKVALIQIAAYDLAHAEDGLQRALEMIDDAASRGVDLIVLPECTYPAYFLRGQREYIQGGLRPWSELVSFFGGKAAEYNCHIVAGLVQPGERNRYLLNAAVLFGPDGKVIGSTPKSLLWHFDRYWFTRGMQYPVFHTDFGRLGMMVCADGRMPEITRILALQGAQLIVDSTAWVTGGSDRAALTNPQVEYMVQTRALENGVWIVAANKIGLEADSVLYCGRSCVIDPDGNRVLVGSTDREEVIFADVDLSPAPVAPTGRRPETYATIVQPTESLLVTRVLHEKVAPETTAVRIAAFQMAERPAAVVHLRRIEELLDTASRQDVKLVVLPGTMPSGTDADATKASATRTRLAELSGQYGCGLAATLAEYEGDRRYRTCFLWDSGRLVGKYRKVHQDEAGYAQGDELPVFDTSFGRLGIVLDEEGLIPEVARCLMLKGADTILWPARASRWPLQTVARSRADENKVHVVLATPVGGGAALVSPSGAVLAAALPNVEQIVAAQVLWALSRYKEMAPGTHVVNSRIPEAYKALAT